MKFHDALRERVAASGDTSPGCWNFVSDIIDTCANYMHGWTNRYDDARRIPDVLEEAASAMRHEAIVHLAVPKAMETKEASDGK